MKPQSQTMPAPLTYEEYCLIPEDGRRHEIIDGVHYVSPAPGYKHQRIVANLHFLLELFLRKKSVGKVMIAPFDVLLSEHGIVQPDLLFITSEHTAIITEKNVQGSPDLMIEVLSEGNRRQDEIVKRELYEQSGIMEYWIVDPALETIKVYQLAEGIFGPPALLSREFGDLYKTPLLPGFHLELDEVFDTK